jgi:hypothetical protein
MNRLSTVGKGIGETAIGSLDVREVQMPKTIHVLSVGPVDFGSIVHDALLDGPNSRLSIAPDYRMLWAIPKQESIQVVILYNTLSSFELDDASRFIRRRWPHARILVVRHGEEFLDDALYDVRVVSNVDRQVLLATIECLIAGWHEWGTRYAEL